MNRKQKKEQIRKLQNKCKLIKQQSEKDIENTKKSFSEKEALYLEYIQILTKRLMDGKHYVTERVCVDVAKDNPWMYEGLSLPLPDIIRMIEEKTMDMMLRELCKRTDLLQRTEYLDHTQFYMEVLKLDDRPTPTFIIPREYTGNPSEEIK